MVNRLHQHSADSAAGAGDPTDSTRAVVGDFVSAWTSGDASRLSALLAPEVVWQPPASISAGRGDRAVVAAALTGGAAGKFVKVETVVRTIRHIIVDGAHAVVLVRMSATTHSGADYVNEYAWHYEVVDGRVTRIEEYADTLKAARLGFLPLTADQ
jgi:ketosteroid isomerase-like protein